MIEQQTIFSVLYYISPIYLIFFFFLWQLCHWREILQNTLKTQISPKSYFNYTGTYDFQSTMNYDLQFQQSVTHFVKLYNSLVNIC